MATTGQFELQVNDRIIKFKNKEKIIEYVESERSTWSWLNESNAHNFLKELFSLLYARPIKNLINNINSLEQTTFNLGEKDCTYISSDSLEGKLVAQIRSDHGDIVAGFLLFFLSNDKKNTNNYTTGYTGRALSDTTLIRDRELASFIAFSNSEIAGVKPRAGSEVVKNLTKRLQKETDEAIEVIRQEERRFKDQNKEFENERNRIFKNQSKQFSRRSQAYRKFSTKTKIAAAECLEKAKEDLDAARTAYHDQVDLEASVTYWETRRTAHCRAKNRWLAGVMLSMTLTLLSLFAYYAIDGISGAKYHLKQHEPDTTPTTQSNINYSPEHQQVNQNPYPQNITSVVADMAGAAILIALFSTLIRIGLRQFNTHSHLEIDSTEKVILTKTYLALLNEGKLTSETDRRLVLEGIFRASNPGVAAAEATFSSPIELVVKSISEKGIKL